MSAIRIENLWKEYDGHIVLERVAIDIAARSFVALVGPSGCGKTTFLRILLGSERPTRGRILLDGKPLPEEPGPDRGIVFQRYSVFPHLTVLGNVLLPCDLEHSPVLGRLRGAARRSARATPPGPSWPRLASRAPKTNTPRPCRAACSSGWPWHRR